MSYDSSKIEKKWQKAWKDADLYKCDAYDFSKPKYYVLDMFPYPSAQGLHVGHVEGYTATDAVARYKRACGYNVLHPMGFDSFGLPAEQYAIKTGHHPEGFTNDNIANFRRQLQDCGFSYDWSREIKTSDPSYYKWTQWIFLKLYDKSLAYIDERPVNYCPELGTVLANEEVIDGKSERGGFPVIRKNMKQWVLKITAYGEKLLDGLNGLDWPSSTIEMQKNWIGESHGCVVSFKVFDAPYEFEVFTTRVDTLFGCTYVVLAPEHPLVKKITTAEHQADIDEYLAKIASKSDLERTALNKEKTGVFTGAHAINPINGRIVKIYIGDYVLASYGTGAVMAVPTHDQRDYEFAKAHNIEMIQVLEGDVSEQAFEGDAPHINSDFANGMNIAAAKKAIAKRLEELNAGRETTSYKLRDWLFSRQRYWGEPIPIIHMEDGTLRKEENLPLVLPNLDDFAPSGDGHSPLAKCDAFVNVEIDGLKGKRETNTMPQWAGSSWYYARYIDPHNDEAIGDKKLLDHWLPVDLYIGGAEHAVLHLLYARFWHKFLHDEGVFESSEPFQKLYHQGMILGSNGMKMSKSLGNVVNPDECIAQYGADALRLYEMFKGPIDQSLPWSDNGLAGARRFIERVYRLYAESEYKNKWTEENVSSLDRIYHATVKKVTEDYNELHFNTAISAMMIYVNELYKSPKLPKDQLKALAQMLAPICPHLGQELYHLLGFEGFIDFVSWPTFDESKSLANSVTYAVQVNGKLKGTIERERDDSDKEAILKEAMDLPNVVKAIEGKTVVKTIVVPNKIVNIVVK